MCSFHLIYTWCHRLLTFCTFELSYFFHFFSNSDLVSGQTWLSLDFVEFYLVLHSSNLFSSHYILWV